MSDHIWSISHTCLFHSHWVAPRNLFPVTGAHGPVCGGLLRWLQPSSPVLITLFKENLVMVKRWSQYRTMSLHVFRYFLEEFCEYGLHNCMVVTVLNVRYAANYLPVSHYVFLNNVTDISLVSGYESSSGGSTPKCEVCRIIPYWSWYIFTVPRNAWFLTVYYSEKIAMEYLHALYLPILY